MLIACKYEEMYIPTVEDFVYITDGTYTTKQVLEMVRKLEQIRSITDLNNVVCLEHKITFFLHRNVISWVL